MEDALAIALVGALVAGLVFAVGVVGVLMALA